MLGTVTQRHCRSWAQCLECAGFGSLSTGPRGSALADTGTSRLSAVAPALATTLGTTVAQASADVAGSLSIVAQPSGTTVSVPVTVETTTPVEPVDPDEPGEPGTDGKPGADGKPGTDGKPAAQGKPGVGLAKTGASDLWALAALGAALLATGVTLTHRRRTESQA